MTDKDPAVLPGDGNNPAAAAGMLWLQTLENGPFDLAWAMLTDDFRLYLVQDWIVQNPGLDYDPSRAGMDRYELAATLAGPAPTHELWARGAALVAERGLRAATVDFLAGRGWGAGSRQRLVGPDLELVRIFPHDQLEKDEGGQLIFASGAVAEVVSLLMAHVAGGWLVAGLGGWLPRPGWPPQVEMVAGPAD